MADSKNINKKNPSLNIAMVTNSEGQSVINIFLPYKKRIYKNNFANKVRLPFKFKLCLQNKMGFFKIQMAKQ